MAPASAALRRVVDGVERTIGGVEVAEEGDFVDPGLFGNAPGGGPVVAGFGVEPDGDVEDLFLGVVHGKQVYACMLKRASGCLHEG